eukprot:TRINITY_DN5539_c0_g2_i2.p1 TRINITY_DN5539_c0_g2~~TRINITY_DN5539_c0_g2_i2.p1  ORF type:complete len:105 (+),score=21.40 TRINITY_DN5539_c0_g2_i2:126-440(+)
MKTSSLLLIALLLLVGLGEAKYSKVTIKTKMGCSFGKLFPVAKAFMDRHKAAYGIKIEVDPKSDPTFLFHDIEGNVVEEINFGSMSEMQMIETLRSHGFLPMKS